MRRSRDAVSSRERHTCVVPATQACRRRNARGSPLTRSCRTRKPARHGQRTSVSPAEHLRVRPEHSGVTEKHARVAPAARCRRARNTRAAPATQACRLRNARGSPPTPSFQRETSARHGGAQACRGRNTCPSRRDPRMSTIDTGARGRANASTASCSSTALPRRLAAAFRRTAAGRRLLSRRDAGVPLFRVRDDVEAALVRHRCRD